MYMLMVRIDLGSIEICCRHLETQWRHRKFAAGIFRHGGDIENMLQAISRLIGAI